VKGADGATGNTYNFVIGCRQNLASYAKLNGQCDASCAGGDIMQAAIGTIDPGQ
jgi:hypothetical protein